jgi:CRISPR-associated protein Cas8a1/Csx13
LEDKQVVIEYRPLVKPYAHALEAKSVLDDKGRPKERIPIKGWLYPGAAERHSTLSGTEMEETPERFLCLLFTPVASLYFKLSHRGSDGKFDKRRSTAVCLPHIADLKNYARCYERYLRTPVQRLSADGLGDAGLSALVLLKADDSVDKLGITGCTVLTMGTVVWSKQQRTRTGVSLLEDIRESVLETFDLACRCLPNRIVVKEPKKNEKISGTQFRYFVSTSLARGLVADNIASRLEWFAGFSQIMCSQQLAKSVGYEKGGLREMLEHVSWPRESDKRFIEAIHVAMRNRYGALASQARQRGENIRFDREFERMRTGLMRAKNAQTLRTELANFFARGGINKILQKDWQQILTLLVSRDWQRTRDLALLGLASYTGKGVEQLVPQDQENNEEEEQP